MSGIPSEAKAKIQAKEFMERLKERKKGAVVYAAQILNPITKKSLISAKELNNFYDFFLGK